MWSVPLIAAVAVIGALALFMTLQPNEAAAQTEEEVPGVPMNLTANGISPTSIELEWEPPKDGDGGSPDHYRIDYSEDNMVWYSLDPSYDSTLYTDDDGLSADEMRYYRVFAVNSTGSSDVLGPVMGTTETSTKPEAVDDLRVSVGANAQADPAVLASTDPVPPATPEENILLNWTPSDDPDGAEVTSYRIQVSKDGKTGWRNLATKTAQAAGCANETGTCAHTHEDLLESTNRWYRVYAINKIGESDASNAPKGSTALGRAPAAVPAVRAGLNPAGEIFLYWDAPVTTDTPPVADEPPGAPLLGYYIQGARGETASPDLSPTPSEDNLFYVGANTDVPITKDVRDKIDPDGDETHTFWTFRVIASNRVVDRNLLDGNLDIDGTDPDDAEVATTSRLQFNAIQEDTDDATVDALLDKPLLKVIRDTNNVGGRISLILEWQVDDAVAAGETGATTYRIEHSTDLVDWEVLVTGAEVVAGTADDDYEYITRAADAEPDDPHQGKHINLVAGTKHYYRVFATHPRQTPTLTAGVFTEASASVSGTTTGAAMPDPPDLTDIFETSETAIRLGWLPPGKSTDDDAATATTNPAGVKAVGYGKITGYLVEYSHDGTDWMDLVTIGNKLDKLYSYDHKTKTLTEKAGIATDHKMWFEHTELYQDQTVHYRVSTINNASARIRVSDASDADSDTTDKALASDDPGGLVVKSRGYNDIMLMWNARADDINAAPVTGYKIESSPLNAAGDDCAENWTTLMEDTMSETTAYTHMGLDASTGMCYRVFGINVVATSTSFVGYGDAYVTTNDNDAIAITDPAMAPGMPTGVMATAMSESHIRVSWTAPDSNGADITGYQVEYTPSGGTAMTYDCTCSDNDANLSADSGVTLMANTEYSLRVRAMNSVGYGEWSDTDTATTSSGNSDPMADLATSTESVMVDATKSVNVSSYFSDADNDTLSYSSRSNNTAVATVNTTGNLVMITGVAAGTAMVTVTASDGMGGTDATHTIRVTVSMELMAPVITLANPVGSGSVGVDWTAVPGATSYVLYAVHLENGDITARDVPPGQTSFSVSGLTQGDNYLIFVGVFAGAANYKLSAYEQVEVE